MDILILVVCHEVQLGPPGTESRRRMIPDDLVNEKPGLGSTAGRYPAHADIQQAGSEGVVDVFIVIQQGVEIIRGIGGEGIQRTGRLPCGDERSRGAESAQRIKGSVTKQQ